MARDLWFVYIPLPDVEAGRTLVHAVMDARLAACANIHPSVISIYPWEGRRMEESEAVLILKTDETRLSELKGLLKQHHPYDCPCIASFRVNANEGFADWVRDQL